MDGPRNYHTKRSKSERERQIPHDITYLESNTGHKGIFPQKKKLMHLKKRLVVAKGVGEGVGWMRSLGLIDANYCLWNGPAVRSCCVALGTNYV